MQKSALPQGRGVGEAKHISHGGVNNTSFAVSWFLGKLEGFSATPKNALPQGTGVGEVKHKPRCGVNVASFAVSWFLGKLEGFSAT